MSDENNFKRNCNNYYTGHKNVLIQCWLVIDVWCIIIISDIGHYYDVFESLTFLSLELPSLKGNYRNIIHWLHVSIHLPGVISHSCWL